ncbi:hypothetical protein D3C81_977170 [compost metagenome]
MRLEDLGLGLASGGVAQMLQGQIGFDQGIGEGLALAVCSAAELADVEHRLADLHHLAQRRTG